MLFQLLAKMSPFLLRGPELFCSGYSYHKQCWSFMRVPAYVSNDLIKLQRAMTRTLKSMRFLDPNKVTHNSVVPMQWNSAMLPSFQNIPWVIEQNIGPMRQINMERNIVVGKMINASC